MSFPFISFGRSTATLWTDTILYTSLEILGLNGVHTSLEIIGFNGD